MMPSPNVATHAMDTTTNDGWGMRIARNIDLVVLVLALGLFLAAGLPILGWVTGAGAWIAQRIVRDFMNARARKTDDPRALVGYLAGSMIAARLDLRADHLRRRPGDRGRRRPLRRAAVRRHLHLLSDGHDDHAAVRLPGGDVVEAATASAAQQPKKDEKRRQPDQVARHRLPRRPGDRVHRPARGVRLRGPERGVPAAERVQARSRGSTIQIGGLDMSINKAVLYLFIAAVLTTTTMIYIAKRMAGQAEPRARPPSRRPTT